MEMTKVVAMRLMAVVMENYATIVENGRTATEAFHDLVAAYKEASRVSGGEARTESAPSGPQSSVPPAESSQALE